ncbi:MAG: class I SAM-dependent methyltransferase [Nitrospiraceae bacterium]
MKTAAALHNPLALTDEILKLRAWRMPDMIAYQHYPDEWWLTPLDDALPLIRLNPMGLELLTSMDGHITVEALLTKYGKWVCSPDGQPGQWHLERWSLPNYSLCYFGTDPPAGDHRLGAKWDLLLQQIREKWSGQEGFEGAGHLADFHLHDIAHHDGHFDTIETTVSHLFREPCEALQGLTYGRLLAKHLRRLGWWSPRPRVILEVGGGLGYVAKEIAAELSPKEKDGARYLFLDVTRPFLDSQLKLAREAGWTSDGTQANAEWLPLKDASVDLVIDNENLADMTPVQLSRREVQADKGDSQLQQEAVDWIRRSRLPLGDELPEEFIFNLGPFRFVAELWRVLRPGGHALLTEFGIETGWPASVKLPGHTEYEVQYTHLRHVARWLGFQERYLPLPQFLAIKPDTPVLCTGAAYAIQRFCEAQGKSFSIRAYTQKELAGALGDMLLKLKGCHYHDISDPAWFGLWDFKVMLLEKPGAAPKPTFTETKGFRWYSQR